MDSGDGDPQVTVGPLPSWFKGEWSTDRPGATPEEIAQAQVHIGHRLPEELCSLLLVQDGGVSNYEAFQDGDRYFPLLPFFAAGASVRADTLSQAFDTRELFELPAGIVVFAAQGHSWWGLDYRSGVPEPTVVFQLDEESDIEVVAPTFRDLLAGLVEESGSLKG